MFAFPSTLSLDRIEVRDQTVIVHLRANSPTATCPRCGTAGSRVHSRYQRSIADVACGGRHLVLKLLVRKWICPDTSCSQRIFAERFLGFVQRYARMTDRLIKVLQAVGVTTNGADAAQILSSLGMPTTAKTIIRRVLELALPTEGTVRVAGIDEWAWKNPRIAQRGVLRSHAALWSIFLKEVEMIYFQEEIVAIKQGESYDTSFLQ